MFSSKLKRMCPYLSKGAARTEAANSVYSVPQAIKSCPYVKELYSGFDAKENIDELPTNVSILNKRNSLEENEANPTLFSLEEEISVCACQDSYNSSEEHSKLCKETSFNSKSQKNDTEAESDQETTNMYDIK